VPDGREGSRGPDVRAAVDASVQAIPGQARHPNVRQLWRVDHKRANVPAQRLHGGGQRGPDERHAGRGPLHVHQLWQARPVQVAHVQNQAVENTPHVCRAELRHADRMVDHAVVHTIRI